MAMNAGYRLGPYEIVDRLGEGGMGEVYRARDTRLGRTVALKLLHERTALDPDARSRFELEARTIASLNHPHICTLHDIGSHDGILFLVVEHLEGETLAHRLRREGPLRAEVALPLARQIAGGLAAAHARDIVHRDLKPENLFLTGDGHVKILDFGVAKLVGVTPEPVDGPQTITGVFMGTMQYAAPEQIRGEPLDPRVDVFAFGVVLYEMLTGKSPFARPSPFESVSAILRDPPPPLPTTVPTHVAGLVMQCLAKDPGARFATGAALVNALRDTARVQETGGGAGLPSIAVLPFADLSAERDQAYFCEGLADELITGLMTLEGLRVASRMSAFQFQGAAHDLKAIGAKLKVGTVLEGSVRKTGTRLRVTVSLTDVESGFQLWSERYDRALDDVFEVQDEIARAVVKKLQVERQKSSGTPLLSRAAPSIEAYNDYLMGRHLLFKLTHDDMSRGMECLKRATDLQPDYAEANATLAYGYLLYMLFSVAPPRDVVPLAAAAAERALRANPNVAEGHLALATALHWYDWKWAAAAQAFERAIQLSPGDANARFNYAGALATTGRFGAAIAEARRAIELDPVSPIVGRSLADALYLAGRFDEAIAHCQRAIAVEPAFFSSYWILGLSLAAQQRYGEAIAALETGRPFAYGDPPLESFLGWTLALAGEPERAREIARQLETRREAGYISASTIGLVYQGLGEMDEALRWYRQAFRDRSGDCVSYLHAPHFAAAREDPRFATLLDRITAGSWKEEGL
jgi:eukaryotic-like serine/threonine-protein kinase